MIDEIFLKYENMICSKICKFSGEICEDPDGCVLVKEVEKLKKEYALQVLCGESE